MIYFVLVDKKSSVVVFVNCTWFRGQKTVSSVLCNSSLDDPLLQPIHVVVS